MPAFDSFAGVSRVAEVFTLGHNKTRPPPCMGWRGPCTACLATVTSCLARPAPPADRQGRAPARGSGFPVPPASPEFPPGPVPASGGEAFLLLRQPAAQEAGRDLLRAFSLSTERRLLSAVACSYPPPCAQPIHRSPGINVPGLARGSRRAGSEPNAVDPLTPLAFLCKRVTKHGSLCVS